MPSSARKIQREECYKSLRRMLLHGLIPPGRRLTETVWSRKLGVTRGSLREAMSMLLHEGLLTRGPRGGFFTPQMTRRDYEEVLEVRFALETGAIRLLARKKNLPRALSARMRETCDGMERMLREDLELGFAEADRRFHELLVEAGHNQRLKMVYSRAPLPLFPSMDPNRRRRRANFLRTLREHRRLYELMEKKNFPRACALLEKHLFASHVLAEPRPKIRKGT